jgi:hypothetical protein
LISWKEAVKFLLRHPKKFKVEDGHEIFAGSLEIDIECDDGSLTGTTTAADVG